MSDQVVIVGGGLTGLVAANVLSALGMRCVVLESGPNAGGRVATVSFPDGATAEGGAEEFWDDSPAYPLLRQLGLPLVEHPAHSSVVIDGRLHPYREASGTGAYFDGLFGDEERRGWARWNEVAAGILDELDASVATGRWSDALSKLRRQSFVSFVERLGLAVGVRTWIRMVLESEIAVEWDRVAAIDAIAEMRPFLVGRPKLDGSRNVRVAGGNGRLIQALVAALPEGTIRTQSRVRRIVEGETGVEVTYDDARRRQRVERGHHVLLTAPVWALEQVHLQPALGPRPRSAMASMAAGSYVKVVLRLRPDRVGILECDGEQPFTLLTDGPAGCLYLADGRTAGRDHVLTMLIHGEQARLLNGRSRGAILARSVRALEGLVVRHGTAPGWRTVLRDVAASITDARVFDHPRAVAYWPHALGRSRYDDLSNALRAPHGRVLIGGDSTDSSHSDGAVAAAHRMVASVLQQPTVATVASR